VGSDEVFDKLVEIVTTAERARSLKKAEKFVKKSLGGLAMLKACEDRTFYAVGGTWRSVGRLHMWQTGYPLHVMHGYAIAADEALEFARLVHRVDVDTLSNIEVVNSARRPLLPYAALVLEYIIRAARPKMITFSTFGVREGLLYSMLPEAERDKDGFICAAQTLNELLSRSARHAQELIGWTDRFVRVVRLRETDEDRRLRHAACTRLSSSTKTGRDPNRRLHASLELTCEQRRLTFSCSFWLGGRTNRSLRIPASTVPIVIHTITLGLCQGGKSSMMDVSKSEGRGAR